MAVFCCSSSKGHTASLLVDGTAAGRVRGWVYEAAGTVQFFLAFSRQALMPAWAGFCPVCGMTPAYILSSLRLPHSFPTVDTAELPPQWWPRAAAG